MKLSYLYATAFLLASCGYCRETFQCVRSEGVRVKLVGFSEEDLDTILVKWYEPGTGFVEPVKESQFDSLEDFTATDVVWEKAPQQPYDVLVELPGADTSFRFTDFAFTGSTSQIKRIKCDDKAYTGCDYTIAYYNINGVQYSLPPELHK